MNQPFRSRQRRVYLFLLASLVLHLLLVWTLRRWPAQEVESVLQPVRFEQARDLARPERFEPSSPLVIPEVVLEQIRLEPEAPFQAPSPEVELTPTAIPQASPPVIDEISLAPLNRQAYRPTQDTLKTLEEIQRDMVRLRADELEAYARLWTPDADTTDEESRRLNLARQIVWAAVEAMGGAAALAQVRHMSYRGQSHKAYGTLGKYSRSLPGGARVVYDGHRGFVDIYGEAYALSGNVLRQLQWRAERWDFLSRYLGDGIRLEYLGERTSADNRRQHGILVNDLRFGGRKFIAYFDEATKLLQQERFTEKHPKYAVNYQDYGPVLGAHLWRAMEIHRFTNAMGRSIFRYARTVYPVSYASIAENTFVLSKPEKGRAPSKETDLQSTLWVDVQMTNAPVPAPTVLPGASAGLTGRRRNMVRDQIVRIAVDDIYRSGLFREVKVYNSSPSAGEVLPQDYVLRISLFHGTADPCGTPLLFYGVLLAGDDRLLMQDGPPSPCYYALEYPQKCGDYIVYPYVVDEAGAYVDRESLRRILRRTKIKIRATVSGVEAGAEELYFLKRCCYCTGP